MPSLNKASASPAWPNRARKGRRTAIETCTQKPWNLAPWNRAPALLHSIARCAQGLTNSLRPIQTARGVAQSQRIVPPPQAAADESRATTEREREGLGRGPGGGASGSGGEGDAGENGWRGSRGWRGRRAATQATLLTGPIGGGEQDEGGRGEEFCAASRGSTNLLGGACSRYENVIGPQWGAVTAGMIRPRR